MFANNKLLQKLWPKLIKSYAMTASSAKKGIIKKQKVYDLFNSIENSDQTVIETPGLGTLMKLQSKQGNGSALVDKPSLVHLSFFPRKKRKKSVKPVIPPNFLRAQRGFKE